MTDTYYAEYGSRVREARKAVGITQDELARVLGLTRASVANIEAGRQKQLADQVITTANQLGVDPRWLLTGWSYGPAPKLQPMASRRLVDAHVRALRRLADQLNEAIR